jgi:hypothetical protein
MASCTLQPGKPDLRHDRTRRHGILPLEGQHIQTTDQAKPEPDKAMIGQAWLTRTEPHWSD